MFFCAYDHNGVLGEPRTYGFYCDSLCSEQRADDADRQRDLDDRMPLVLDDYATDSALVNESFDSGGQFLAPHVPFLAISWMLLPSWLNQGFHCSLPGAWMRVKYVSQEYRRGCTQRLEVVEGGIGPVLQGITHLLFLSVASER